MNNFQQKIQTAFKSNFYLKILFFFDQDFSQEEEIGAWQLSDIEYIKFDGLYFSIKQNLYEQYRERHVFLHFPFSKPTHDAWLEFPLLSEYYANSELRLDEEAEFMQRYQLGKQHQGLVRKYRDALKTKKLQNILINRLNNQDFNENILRCALISAAFDVEHLERTHLLMRLFSAKPEQINTFLQRIEKLNLGGELSEWTDQLLGERPSEWQTNTVTALLCRLKYNLLTLNVETISKEDTYQKLKIDNFHLIQKLKAFWSEWTSHPRYKDDALLALNEHSKDIDERKILAWYGIEMQYDLQTPQMLTAVLFQLLKTAANQTHRMSELLLPWRDSLQKHAVYQYLYHFSALENVLKTYNNFDFSTLNHYVENYQKDLYQVDFHYRKAIVAYKRIEEDNLFEQAKPLNQSIQDRYEDYLKRLNVSWMKLLQQTEQPYRAMLIAKQYDFFKGNILGKETKTVVIISDALRYEVAQELYDRLAQEDNRIEMTLQAMLASIPSYTKLGMAQLLPHQSITIDNNIKNGVAFKINGISTEGLDNRTKILKQYGAEHEAISYTKVIGLDRDAGRDFFKGNNKVVYIFHNRIDVTGDNQKTQQDVFEETDTTIIEITKLLGKFKGWNVENIFITADHGFIYNNRALNDATLHKAPENLLEQHTRFAYGEKNTSYHDVYTFALNQTTQIESNLQVILPKAINRFGKQGSTTQYVHGGGSLQELIIPLICYNRKRENISTAVNVRMITPESKLKLNSGNLKLTFLQEEASGIQKKSTLWNIGLYDRDGQLLSNEETLLFDSAAAQPSERSKTIILQLSSEGSRQAHCYLRAYDVTQDKQRLNPKMELRLDNQSLMEIDDF